MNPFLKNKGGGALTVNLSDGRTWTQVDGDTWRDSDGNRYRIGGGIDLEETAKVIRDDEGQYEIKQGQLGGRAATKAAWQLQQAGGFSTPVHSGKYDENDREIIDFQDANGNLLSEALYTSGVAEVTRYTEQNALTAVNEARLREEADGTKAKYSDLSKELNELRGHRPWKPTALNEQQYAQDPELFEGVAFRHAGRTLDNRSLNPLSDSWSSGWAGVREGLGGFLDLIGSQTGSEWIEGLGEGWRTRAQLQLNDIPELTLDYTQVDSVWDGFQYVGNNAVMSLPYLGIAALGTILSPVTGGASAYGAYGTLFSSYAGQAWNEMEGEKGGAQASAALAAGAAMTALDRLGIEAIAGRLFKPQSLLTKEGRLELTKKLVQDAKKNNPNLTTKQIRDEVNNRINFESRKAVSEAINRVGGIDAAGIAAAQYARGAARGGAQGFLGESVTEVAQEGLQAATVAAVSDTEYTKDEVINRLLNAGLAGGSVGAGFGAAGGLRAEAAQGFYRGHQGDPDQDQQTALDRLREADIAAGDIPKSIDQNLVETRQAGKIDSIRDEPKYSYGYSVDAANRHQATRRGAKNVASNALVDLPSAIGIATEGAARFFRASGETAVPEAMALAYPALRQVKAMLMNGLVGGSYYSGRSETSFRDSIQADFEEYVNPLKVIKERLGHSKTTDIGVRENISKDIREFIDSGAYQILKDYKDGKGDLDYTKIDPKFHSKANELFDTVNDFAEGYDAQIYGFQDIHAKEHGSNIPEEDLNPYQQWWNLKTPDVDKIRKNRGGFKKFLQNNTNLSDTEIDQLINDIVNNEVAEEDSSTLATDFRPWASSLTKLSTVPGSDKFFNDDMFDTYDKMTKRTAKYISSNEYWGAKGRNLDVLLQQAREQGASQEEVDHVAWHVKAILDSQNGVRNRITNPRLAAAVKMATSITAIVGLPLSSLSSIPETALILEKIDNDVEMQQAVKAFSDELGGMFKKGLDDTYDYYYKGGSKGQALLSKSGLPLSATAAQQRLGVGSTSHFMQKWVQRAFKVYGIQHLTAFQRRTAASFGADFVMNRLEELSVLPTDRNGILDRKQMNRRHQEMYNELSKLGMDVDKMASLFSKRGGDRGAFDMLIPKEERADPREQRIDQRTGRERVDEDTVDWIDEQMQTAIYSFVNQKVQNPGAANRGLIWQDPQLQMFTQFQGFISTWTATGLPRLLERLKYGQNDTRANTAALVLLMIGLGGASQYLKDLIKHGQASPYLENDWKFFQRALMSSGVIGQYERPLSAVLPLYEDRDRGFEKIWNTLVGEAGPTARYATTLSKIPGDIQEGDTESLTRNVLKSVPVTSVLPGTRNWLIDYLHGRSPKGDLE